MMTEFPFVGYGCMIRLYIVTWSNACDFIALYTVKICCFFYIVNSPFFSLQENIQGLYLKMSNVNQFITCISL